MAFGSARAAATSSIDRSSMGGAMEHALRVERGTVLYRDPAPEHEHK